jgi:hypothetical protein
VQNEYVTTPACHVPGLAAYGAATISKTDNGRTVATEYRVSHDYGATYTDWAAVGASIADTPDSSAEFIQFRIRATDSGTGIALHTGVSVACTFATGWTPTVLAAPYYIGGVS